MSDLKTEKPDAPAENPVADVEPAAHAASSPNGIGPAAAAPDAADPARASDEDGEKSDGAPSDEKVARKADTKDGAKPIDKDKPGNAEKDAEKEEGPPLLPKGNPLRITRGGTTAVVGALIAFLLMAHNAQLPYGVPLGLIFVGVAAWGVMDLLGTFDDPADRVISSVTLSALAIPLARAVVGMLLFGGALFGGQSGWGSQWMWGGVVTVTFLFWTASVFELGVVLGPWAKDELGLSRPLLKRHGFWVMVAGALLYFPAMGLYSLWDPWETHYGEVAREILARDDWISLWWAQDGWFWSKPILNFWMQSIAMATLRTHYQPDEMLNGLTGHATAHPEWVVRAPNVLLTLVAMYLLYKGVAKVFGRRAGLLGALVLATVPDWFFLAHQTMTDMPFVAAMTAAMGLLLLGLHTNEEARTRVYRVDVGKLSFGLTGWHLAFGLILICGIPQVLYLLSRNLELVLHGPGDHGLRPHFDEFRSGSAGNCSLPGNENCLLTQPASIPKSVGAHPEGFGPSMTRLFGGFEPVLQGILWATVLGTLLYINWGERRLRRIYYVAAWFFAAIATMGKGPAGFALPMICAFAYVCTKKRWSELARLEIMSGLLIIGCVALPWYVAMYVRHGSPFTDRLIFHDMFNRAFHHVHDTNEGDDTSFRFYIWQLGYALFPWTGLVPLGLTFWLRRSDSAERGKGDVAVFLFMWFLFAFALFSFMGTKFHHYIFPAVPPAAMLVGIVLDQMLGDEPVATEGLLPYLVGGFSGLMLCVAGAAMCWPGSLWGTKEMHSDLAPGKPILGGFIVLVGVAMTVLIARMFRKKADEADRGGQIVSAAYRGGQPSSKPGEAKEEPLDPRAFHERVMLGGAALAGGLVLLLVGRDLVIKPENADQPGAIRLLQLFTYNYRRPWPETLDFSAILLAFTFIAVLLSLALSVRALRKHVVLMFAAFSFVWALYGLDVYMVKTAPHWGQHEVIQAYYANRAGPEEPLIAYQMNWKGENFYTSNHVPAFVSTGSTFANWMKQQREKGVKVMYFITEHSRIGGLKSEVGGKAYREITDKALCNKFVVVRAEL
jgi:4-amino-4-deoxy-L-arabinose transferase-like glycosyltransferase